MFSLSLLLALLACWSHVTAHNIITYPGWRGDNLITSGRLPDETIPPGSLGMNWDNSTNSYTFPYGMQWMYPCQYFTLVRYLSSKFANQLLGGGMPVQQNRTKWPVNGGAVAFQPGWFAGHQTSFIYINLGIGNEPLNYSHIMNPVFQLVGPSNQAYPGTFCVPQVPLPANLTFKVGDNATIQLIQTALHGAALYSVCLTAMDKRRKVVANGRQ